MHLFRVTDESGNIPIKDRKWFGFPLSIHGIERAGVEGGVRAAEDLATWAACESDEAPDFVDCEGEVTGTEQKPYPLMEASPGKSVGTGDALKKAVVVSDLPEPGRLAARRPSARHHPELELLPALQRQRRGREPRLADRRAGPTVPTRRHPSPRRRPCRKVLPAMGPKDKRGNPKWAGGIDLHGQLSRPRLLIHLARRG